MNKRKPQEKNSSRVYTELEEMYLKLIAILLLALSSVLMILSFLIFVMLLIFSSKVMSQEVRGEREYTVVKPVKVVPKSITQKEHALKLEHDQLRAKVQRILVENSREPALAELAFIHSYSAAEVEGKPPQEYLRGIDLVRYQKWRNDIILRAKNPKVQSRIQALLKEFNAHVIAKAEFSGRSDPLQNVDQKALEKEYKRQIEKVKSTQSELREPQEK